MFHAAHDINANVMWANMHLLFWLSLIPFATGWMGENHFTTLPVAAYGIILLMSGVAYYILAHALVRHHGENSTLARAFGRDWKGLLSVVIYAVGIAVAFVNSWISFGIYTMVAAIWFIPDKRIEKKIKQEEHKIKT